MENRWKKEWAEKHHRETTNHGRNAPATFKDPLDPNNAARQAITQGCTDPNALAFNDCRLQRMNTQEAVQLTLLDDSSVNDMLAATKVQAQVRGKLARENTEDIAAETYVHAAQQLSSRNLLAAGGETGPPIVVVPRKKEFKKFELAPHALREQKKNDKASKHPAPPVQQLPLNPHVNKGLITPNSVVKGANNTLHDQATHAKDAVVHANQKYNPLYGAIGMYKEAVGHHVAEIEHHVKQVKHDLHDKISHHVVDAEHYFHLTDNHTKKMHFFKHHSTKDIRVRI
jgi:hypothetical protein